MFKTPILMLKMTFFWLLFRGKFEQKTQKSISFKNQWRLKNIKKAMVVKNIIADDMSFTKSIFEQFWRSYCKKTIFVVFHFLKFLPIIILKAIGGSTKGVRVHLSLHHKREWKEIEEKERERKGKNENEKVPNKGERIQPTIKASFEQMSKCAWACDRNKWK